MRVFLSQRREKLRDGAVQRGVLHCWGDLCERREDEGALVHGGVRECQLWCLHDRVAVEQQVQVNDAWALGWGVGAVAAHGVFDGEQVVKEIEWGERCFEKSGGVDETRLIEVANGVGGVEGGDGGDRAQRFEVVEGFVEVRCRIAEG